MSVLRRLTSPFYATGATFLGSTDKVDRAIAEGARAEWRGNAVAFVWPDGREIYKKVGVGRRASIVRWINAFNERGGT